MQILPLVSMREMNTLGLPAVADWLCSITSLEDVTQALEFARAKRIPVCVLGGGSNTVLRARVPGLVMKIANQGLEIIQEDEKSVTLRVAAGENWHELVINTLDRGWFGLENLALIPGNVGAAPIQNIGAYGVELSNFLEAVDIIDIATSEFSTLGVKECELGYRDSIFKNRLKNRVIIWSVRLTLSKVALPNLGYPELARSVISAEPTPAEVANTVIRLRQSKLPDPEKIPNAGSFFKNPILSAEKARHLVSRLPDIPQYPQPDGSVKFPAAWLIDRAGWKGKRLDDVGVHDKQALVLVNYGDGSSAELLSLAEAIAGDIHNKFEINLEMEPVILGVGR